MTVMKSRVSMRWIYEADVKKAIAQATEKFGRIDVVVNNAGFTHLATIEEMSDADAREEFDINVFGTLKALYPGGWDGWTLWVIADGNWQLWWNQRYLRKHSETHDRYEKCGRDHKFLGKHLFIASIREKSRED